MGTDYVRLFDKRMSRQIMELDEQGLIAFTVDKWDQLTESFIHDGYVEGTPVLDHVKEMLISEFTPSSLKKELVLDLCRRGKTLYLDYWACYAEVFEGHPPGSMSSMELLPDEPEEIFLLLLPEHVDRMLAGLASHSGELDVMAPADVAELKVWNDQCRADPRMAIIYFYG